MKPVIFAAAALAAVCGNSIKAEACNPMLGKDFGKHVAPIAIPAGLLARNHPAASGQSSVVGLWHDVRTLANGAMFMEGFDTWSRDGTEYELANLPPATGPICVGAWIRHGKTIELLTHLAYLYDLNNNPVGTINITQTMTVSADGNSYTGPFDAKFYDTNGVMTQELTGTSVGERIAQ